MSQAALRAIRMLAVLSLLLLAPRLAWANPDAVSPVAPGEAPPVNEDLAYFNEVVLDPARIGGLTPPIPPASVPLTDAEKIEIAQILAKTPSVDSSLVLNSIIAQVPFLNGQEITRRLTAVVPEQYGLQAIAKVVLSFINVEGGLRAYLRSLEEKIRFQIVYHSGEDSRFLYRPEIVLQPFRSFTLYLSVHWVRQLEETFRRVRETEAALSGANGTSDVLRFLTMSFALETIRKLIDSHSQFVPHVLKHVFRDSSINLSYMLAAAFMNLDLRTDSEFIRLALGAGVLLEQDLMSADGAGSIPKRTNDRISAFYNNYNEVRAVLRGESFNIYLLAEIFKDGFKDMMRTDPKPVEQYNNSVVDKAKTESIFSRLFSRKSPVPSKKVGQ